jgi:DNA-binding transcriptional MerR regulator
MNTEKKLLRIGQLAKKAGVSTATVKHYLKEGLLPQPVKTSPNMAYYDESCVDRINLIKRIQKEKFLPLDVIKRLVESGESYSEELELGKAILKSHKELPPRSVKGSQVTLATGYPLDKITMLEEEGLIFPIVKNNVKYYDSSDLEIIEIMKQREDLGLSFHHSLETIRIYRDAITRAVQDDIRLFVNNFLGDVSTRQAIKFLTEADDALDRFMTLFRYNKLRSFSENAIREMNQLPARLGMINIFPVEGRDLPATPPEDLFYKTICCLCQADCDALMGMAQGQPGHPDVEIAVIFSSILRGNNRQALKIVQTVFPTPSARVLDNIIAALAYLLSIDNSTGLSAPMYHTKRAIDYLKRVEALHDQNPLLALLARYVTGAVYTVLPGVLETREKGVNILERLSADINSRRIKTGRLPKWLARTLDYEIIPALLIRMNRFLAQAYLEQSRTEDAVACLENIIETSDPENEHVDWARMTRLQLQT